MKYHTVKRLAAVSAVALALVFGAHEANAQQEVVGASFATAVALTSDPGTDMDFGTWVANIQGGDTPTLTLLPSVAGAPPVPAVADDANSVVVNTVAPATAGTFTVTSPIAVDLEIQGSVTTPFGEANLTLNNLTYADFDTASAALPAAYDGSVVTIQPANVGLPETISIGGDLTIAATLPDATAYTDAEVTVDVRY